MNPTHPLFGRMVRTLMPLAASLVVITAAAAPPMPAKPSNPDTALEAQPVSDAIRKQIEAALAPIFSGASAVQRVSTTPLPGIYEVQVSRDIIYSDATGRFLLRGQILDLATQRNLTAARLEALSAIDFASLPLKLAVQTGASPQSAKPGRVLAVFEDPYCSFCKKLRRTLQDEFPDVTVYSFLVPMLRPESATVARNIWCAKDRAKALDAWMLSGTTPPTAKADCAFPQAELLALADSLGVNSTPISFTASGQRIIGALEAENFERAFATAASAAR